MTIRELDERINAANLSGRTLSHIAMSGPDVHSIQDALEASGTMFSGPASRAYPETDRDRPAHADLPGYVMTFKGVAICRADRTENVYASTGTN